MKGYRLCFGLVMGLAWLVLLPAAASAQSAFAGTVTDNTGAVLPGVTVEASSPALIEQSRSAVTDGQGRYTIVQLRPGTYKLTFTLVGFGTSVRDGVVLPSDFTATINVQLSVGSLEESVTVSGQAPIVDLQSAAKTEVISRALLDALPTPRNTQSFGYLAQGVRLSKPDVGGQQQMEQVNMRVHGAGEVHTTMQIDGMLVSPAFSDGAIQNYMNQAHFQETTFTTSSQLAEVSAGGVRLNMVPRDGGNVFSGAMYFGTTESGWQANNLTPSLIKKGLTLPTGVDHIRDYNPALGGPIMQNKLWFLTSFRYTSVNEHVVNSYLPDGSPAVVDQYVDTALVRLTAQPTSRNKLSVFLDRAFKYKGHEFTFGIEPSRASRRRNPSEANYHTAGVKWTSTISNRVLLETGFTRIVERLHSGYQPDIFKQTTGWPRPANLHLFTTGPNVDPWFTGIGIFDIPTNTLTNATTGYSGTLPDRYVPMMALSYVTGTHNFKVGWQWAFGQDRNDLQSNGDIEQVNYRTGVPETVVVSGGPYGTEERVRADVGIYAQDSWKVKRLTLNVGIRHEYFNSGINAQWAPEGRFVPSRVFDRIDCLPCWHDWTPRLGVAYDLFGDGKTAIKGGINKYMRPYAGSFAKRYNPMRAGGLTTDTRNWNDCTYLAGTSTCDPVQIGSPTYHDGIVQDNEIGPSGNKFFGIGAARAPAPGIRRDYNVEETVSVQHQLMPRVGVTFGWYRRQYYNLQGQQNLAITPVGVAGSDWIPFQVANPLGNGETITIYNLSLPKLGAQNLLDYNSKINTHISNDFEVSFTARLPNAGTVFGGWTAMRNVENNCDQVNPNGSNSADLYSSITFLQGGRFCDQSKLSIPYRSDFKLAGNYPLPGGFEFSGTFVSFAGNMTQVVWNVPASVFPNSQRTQTTLVALIAPGTQYLERWNQLDISGKKTFKVGRYTFGPQLDIYNVLNGAAIQTQNTTFGTSLGTPQTILNGRLMRLVGQLKW